MRLATSVSGHSVGGWRGTRTGRFVRHLLEMTVAMVLGMVVLGAAFGEIHLLVFGSGFDQAWHRHVELTAFAMAFNMTLPMVAWMRHRGHSWRSSAEMAAAMFAPAIPVIALLRSEVIAFAAVCGLYCAVIMAAMLALMLYRRSEYAM